jgi:hypothetical protein
MHQVDTRLLLLPTHPQVENGDLNWIVPGKLVAFSGPAVRPTDYVGFRAMVPEDYWDYWHKRGVQAIVRLNKKVRQRVFHPQKGRGLNAMCFTADCAQKFTAQPGTLHMPHLASCPPCFGTRCCAAINTALNLEQSY